MPDRPPNPAHIAALRLPLDQLPDPLPIPVIERPFDVAIRPPGSKSITNRALLLAALADGTSELRGPLIDADDAQVMLRAIQQLGAKVEIVRGSAQSATGCPPLPASVATGNMRETTGSKLPVPPDHQLDIVRITGVNGRWKIPAGQTITLNLNNAGTATRFLTAAAILAPADSGGIIIDGDARMRERPIGELVDALTQLGIHVEYLGKQGNPPLRVMPPANLRQIPTRVVFNTPQSSQFISAIMLVSPFFERTTTIEIHGRVLSEPYIEMSLSIIREVGGQRGATPSARSREGSLMLNMPVNRLRAFAYEVEPDASGASYFFAAAMLCEKSRVLLAGLHYDEWEGYLQGDLEFLKIMTFGRAVVADLEEGTSLRPPSHSRPAIEYDFTSIPDTAMTAAAIACFASPTPENPTATTTLRGLRTLRVKETDRLAALQTELSKLGARVEIFKDNDDEGLRITPPPPSALGPAPSALFFDTYNDHRMAMALALIGLRRPNVFIRNPACVAKTYPTFWQDLARLYEPRTK